MNPGISRVAALGPGGGGCAGSDLARDLSMHVSIGKERDRERFMTFMNLCVYIYVCVYVYIYTHLCVCVYVRVL